MVSMTACGQTVTEENGLPEDSPVGEMDLEAEPVPVEDDAVDDWQNEDLDWDWAKEFGIGNLTIGVYAGAEAEDCFEWSEAFIKYAEKYNIDFVGSNSKSSYNGEDYSAQWNLNELEQLPIDGLITLVKDPEVVRPYIERIKNKGIPIVSYGEYLDIADYSFVYSNYDIGYAIGEMAAEWANNNIKDDKVTLGILTVEENEAGKDRSNGIEKGFLENCPRGEVVRQPVRPLSGEPREAFETMLSSKPDIKVVASLADDAVTGIAKYWYDKLIGMGKDVNEYGVFAAGATNEAMELINQAKSGGAIFRGTINMWRDGCTSLALLKCCHAAILGVDLEEYGQRNSYVFEPVTEKNISRFDLNRF